VLGFRLISFSQVSLIQGRGHVSHYSAGRRSPGTEHDDPENRATSIVLERARADFVPKTQSEAPVLTLYKLVLLVPNSLASPGVVLLASHLAALRFGNPTTSSTLSTKRPRHKMFVTSFRPWPRPKETNLRLRGSADRYQSRPKR